MSQNLSQKQDTLGVKKDSFARVYWRWKIWGNQQLLVKFPPPQDSGGLPKGNNNC